uniref:Aspartyl-tRNA synthetase n=1 Tax=Brassica oleracea var. oleracea TaxID=109376 RepID=A0A0D3DSU0_BRAOL
MAGSEVLIRGRVHTYRPQSSKVFVILRQSGCTVQCVAEQSNVGVNMIKYLKQLSYESFVDVIGVVVVPKDPVKGTTQKVEIQVRKVYYVNRALERLPLGVEDAARSEADIEKSLETGTPAVRVNQDTRLNNRVVDIRTPANQAIVSIGCQFENFFRGNLLSMGFVSIHTPKLLAGSSEGGYAVFRLDYKGQPACLADVRSFRGS